ncbi:MAG: dioxygenase, partial [Deltaproteobacteria bacterium]|nr:dioxygenase [Deltaproteobacteria bacterium]
PAHHLAMGRTLQPLRDDGILVLGSGGATHNLREIFIHTHESEIPGYVRAFNAWLKDAVINNHQEDLLDYLNKGPNGRRNHPTAEHFLPLFVPMGAGGKGRLLHSAYTFGVLSMAAFAWE